LEQLQQDCLAQLLEVLTLGDDIEVHHRIVDAHALKLDGLVHVTQVQKLNNVVKLDQGNQVLLAQSLQPVQAVLVCCHQNVNGLIGVLDLDKLVRIDEFQKLLESWKGDVLHANDRFLGLSHANAEHVLEEVAS
jgi:hypothetical protein